METYTADEVRKHCTKKDLWIIWQDNVYDVTGFISKHPGGVNVLLGQAGQDVSEVMKNSESHQHSSSAYSMLSQYKIGSLTSEESTTRRRNHQKNPNAGLTFDEQLKESVDPYASTIENNMQHEDLVDWSKPLVGQVGSLGEKYMEWVHTPVDKPLRFFQSNFMETMSKSSWYEVPIVWLPVVLIYALLSSWNFQDNGDVTWMPQLYGGIAVGQRHMVVLVLAGIVMWTFIEYIVHRWLFHLRPPSQWPSLITAHFLLHGQHHKVPMDHKRLVFPPLPAAAFGVTISSFYLMLFPRAMAQSMLAGTGLGYIMYDLMHYYLHYGTSSIGYFQEMKKYHVMHHFIHQEKGFGITQKLWDHTFGTVIRTTRKIN